MRKSKNELNTKEVTAQYGPDTINSLISDLDSKNKLVRVKAHDSLLAVGESVVSTLVKALSNPRERVRWEAGKILDEINVAWSNHADARTINALIADLGSKDGLVRVRARLALVTIGRKAVVALREALTSKEEWKRWEAAKALGQISDPSAIGALVRSLEDEMFDVRWLAAEGLIAIGPRALVPLLRQLTKQPDSLWLREGAHRILHSIDRKDLRAMMQPVLRALEDVEAPLEVPFAAEATLKSLTRVRSKALVNKPETTTNLVASRTKSR